MKQNSIWQLTVRTTLEAEDAVGALLEGLSGITPTSYTDADSGVTTVAVCSQESFGKSLRWRAELVAGIERIRSCGLDAGAGRFAVRRLKRENWAESWKRHFKPLIIGKKLLVKPSWSRRRAARGQAVVILDPGLSFGTGQHPTTRFCLQQLSRHRRAGAAQSLLDVGTGSGILAIAAAKLGYARVDAFDFDPESIRVATQNARVNGVAKKIRLSQADITKPGAAGGKKYSVVCANLLANLLLAERRKLTARLAPGGVLVVAGILQREFHLVRSEYERAGMRLIATRVEKEWQSGAFVLA